MVMKFRDGTDDILWGGDAGGTVHGDRLQSLDAQPQVLSMEKGPTRDERIAAEQRTLMAQLIAGYKDVM